MGRIIYFPFPRVQQKQRMPESMTIENGGVGMNGKRLQFLGDVKVDWPKQLLPTGQFFPYEIFGDVYGQRLIPENVGNVQPYMNEQVHKTLQIDDLIRIMKRNRVLRDFWGSFFIHPFQLEDTVNGGIGKFPGESGQIQKLIREARAAGYEFMDLKAWVKDTRLLKRPEPIEQFIEN